MGLKVTDGDQLPSVGLRATDGYLLNLRSLVGKQPAAYLFFGSPTMRGASAEPGRAACRALKAGHRRLDEAGIAVVGISCDSEEEQREFAEREALPFLLMSDERRTAVELLGIPTVSQRENFNVARPVALGVDRDGTVRTVIERVDPGSVVEELASALAEPITADAAEPAIDEVRAAADGALPS